MSARHTSARTIRRALDVLLRLPAEALGDLAERLIDRLDVSGPDPDAEPDDDGEFDQHGACDCGDDDPRSSSPQFGAGHGYGPGELDDAEPDFDAEPPCPAFHHGPDVVGARCWTGAA